MGLLRLLNDLLKQIQNRLNKLNCFWAVITIELLLNYKNHLNYREHARTLVNKTLGGKIKHRKPPPRLRGQRNRQALSLGVVEAVHGVNGHQFADGASEQGDDEHSDHDT